MEKYEELYELFRSQDPNITWAGIITKKGPEEPNAAIAFSKYFREKYVLIEKLRVPTGSTDRLFYSIYYNEEQNDVRIEKLDYGCFHGRDFFIDIEEVNKTIKYNEKAVPGFIRCSTSLAQKSIGETLMKEIDVLKQVQAIYKRLKGIV